MSEANSAWNLEVDLEHGQLRRVRDYTRDTGIPALPMEKKLRETFVFIAGLAEMAGDKFSSDVIEAKASELAYGWARVAQENERVRLVLDWIITTNAWTDAIAPTVIVTGAIAYRYNMLPESIGEPIAKFSGAVPLTPEEEAERKKQAEAFMEFMQSQEEPHQEPPQEAEPVAEQEQEGTDTTQPDTPSVVPIPPDASLDE